MGTHVQLFVICGAFVAGAGGTWSAVRHCGEEGEHVPVDVDTQTTDRQDVCPDVEFVPVVRREDQGRDVWLSNEVPELEGDEA